MTSIVHHGDCREVMATLDAASVDAVVCDPPYGLSFMGKGWDHGVPGVEFWTEVLRVAKPGAHLLAFGGTRTHHRLMVAIEDAGWEIRDCVMWVYGSGFPKSLNVSKAIDKAAGAEREVVGQYSDNGRKVPKHQSTHGAWKGESLVSITAPATDADRQWSGWGTALKPAWEPIIVARKPLCGTVADNVLRHGTGALNIDACRVETGDVNPSIARRQGAINHLSDRPAAESEADGRIESRQSPEAYRAERAGEALGRWPANLIHDGSEDVVGLFPVTGASSDRPRNNKVPPGKGGIYGHFKLVVTGGYQDNGGSAARFFYCAKASKQDRDEACEGLEARDKYGPAGQWGSHDCFSGKSGDEAWKAAHPNMPKLNHHPTVKPTALMCYLCRLVTPPGGIVLDPFMGSGSTGKAAAIEGFNFIGIEQEAKYVEIARARIAAAVPVPEPAA